ncbi:hypothetical protein J6590_022527 [Homalodisca vitripennis]|nr:hypothetical protein J6590_022527 [Homalodisca vitripennis]
MYAVKDSSCLECIDHQFFEPGHSFIECDEDFGVIEKYKKQVPYMFIPNEWKQAIGRASRKFVVKDMSQHEFKKVSLKKVNVGRSVNVTLGLLYSQPIPLKYPKWKDLQTLLPCIPPCYHSFYQNLPHLPGPHKKDKSKTQDPPSSTNSDLIDDWNILASDYEDEKQSSK